MKKDICEKEDLWCECTQCNSYWDDMEQDMPTSLDSDFEYEKDLDTFYDQDGW